MATLVPTLQLSAARLHHMPYSRLLLDAFTTTTPAPAAAKNHLIRQVLH